MPRSCRHAFTLVEILIVVVILGILAAVVVPQLVNATEDSAEAATQDQLNKIRRAIGVYRARNDGELPSVEEGDGTWGPLVGPDYLLSAPINSWVGGVAGRAVVFGDGPDPAFHEDYGWIYDPNTGDVWAAAFDDADQPLPR